MELIEEGAPVWVGQGFKDVVHTGTKYATKWLHISPSVANPKASLITTVFPAKQALKG